MNWLIRQSLIHQKYWSIDTFNGSRVEKAEKKKE